MNATTTNKAEMVKLATIARDGVFARVEVAINMGRTDTATFRDLLGSLAYYNEMIRANS